MQQVGYTDDPDSFLPEIPRSVLALCTEFDFDHCSYGLFTLHSKTFYIATTLPRNMVEEYLAQEDDPSLGVLMHSTRPLDWQVLGDLDIFGHLGMFAPHNYGNQGITVPQPGPPGAVAIFGFSKTCDPLEWRVHMQRHRDDLIRNCQSCNARATALLKKIPGFSIRELNFMQTAIFQQLAAGHSQKAIADNLGINSSSLEGQILRARKKLGAATTYQAIVKAAALRVIHPV